MIVNPEVEQYRLQKAHILNCKTKALAYLNRGKNAGIPEKYLRINKDDFSKVLHTPYYGGIKEARDFSSLIYDNPNNICNIPYILIDGGDIINRRLVSFAVLFRIITCDKHGLVYDFTKLYHMLEDFRSDRNGIVQELVVPDILLIDEIKKDVFKPDIDCGTFMDEIIQSRSDALKQTVFSFSDGISEGGIRVKDKSVSDRRFGEYLAKFMVKERCDYKSPMKNPSGDFLRIRVRMS